jgi:hypothetical protein
LLIAAGWWNLFISNDSHKQTPCPAGQEAIQRFSDVNFNWLKLIINLLIKNYSVLLYKPFKGGSDLSSASIGSGLSVQMMQKYNNRLVI